jgi:HK97 family phage major capsid protein
MTLSTHALKEKRAAKQDEMKAIMAKADISNEDRARFDSLEAETRNLNADLRRVAVMEEAERNAHAEPVDGSRNGVADLERRFSPGKALFETYEGKLTGAEAEYAAEHRSGRKGAVAMPVSAFFGEMRTLTTTAPSGGPGGNLVQTNLGPMIDRLRPLLAVETLGATVLSGLTGNLDLPRHKSSGSAGWVGEHGAATGSDPQFDKVSLAPKTVTAQYEVSRRMLLQAANLDAVLRGDLGYLLAQAIDAAAIRGGGSNEPSGILANSSVGVVSMGTNGAALGLDTAADLMGLIDDANVIGATGFLTNTKVKKAAMKLKDGQGRPFTMGDVFKASPVAFSNQVPGNLTKGTGTNLSALIYGNWSDLIVAYWSSVDIVLNPYADSVASKGGALMHAFLDADIAIRHPESFAVAKDVVA